tara:strand:+ start:720 stop:1544 length:825 start_codon:yes stop_codon:yes gene_type:complete
LTLSTSLHNVVYLLNDIKVNAVKIFVVLAHPEPTSYNGHLFRIAQDTLRESGHEVRVSDLHGMGFNPTSGFHDVTDPVGSDVFQMQIEQEHAANTGTFARDIAAEQEKLYWCDLVIFQFPLWWFGIPGILKGWFDRVLAFGWAYHRRERFDSGRLRGRQAMISVTTGGPKDRFAEGAMFAPLEQLLFPVTVGTLQYVGFDMLEPYIAWSVPRVSDEDRRNNLDTFRERLKNIDEEIPMPFHSIQDFPDPMGETLSEPQGILESLMEQKRCRSSA